MALRPVEERQQAEEGGDAEAGQELSAQPAGVRIGPMRPELGEHDAGDQRGAIEGVGLSRYSASTRPTSPMVRFSRMKWKKKFPAPAAMKVAKATRSRGWVLKYRT